MTTRATTPYTDTYTTTSQLLPKALRVVVSDSRASREDANRKL